MSYLRISRPGCATELIDLGPATGRTTYSRYATRGATHAPTVVGEFVTGIPREYDPRPNHRKRAGPLLDITNRKRVSA